MKKLLFFPIFLFCFLATAYQTMADTNVVYCNSIASVQHLQQGGINSWGPESEGLWHPYPNPFLVQSDQIKRVELCVLDAGGRCTDMGFGTLNDGHFFALGQIWVSPCRDIQIKVTTWSDLVYWAAIDAPGKPMSYFWDLHGCYLVQRPDGTWGVRMDP